MEKKRKGLIILGVIFLQCLFLLGNLSQNVNASDPPQDDSNLEAVLHCKLEADSSEIASELMPTGTYDFFEQPDLDVGTFEHDLTMVNFSRLQDTLFNQTNTTTFVGQQNNNITMNNTRIEEYITSAGFESNFELHLNSSSYTNETFDSVDIEETNPDGDSVFTGDITDLASEDSNTLDIVDLTSYRNPVTYYSATTATMSPTSPSYDIIWTQNTQNPSATMNTDGYDWVYVQQWHDNAPGAVWAYADMYYKVELNDKQLEDISAGREVRVYLWFQHAYGYQTDIDYNYLYYGLMDGDAQTQTVYTPSYTKALTDYKYNFTITENEIYNEKYVRIHLNSDTYHPGVYGGGGRVTNRFKVYYIHTYSEEYVELDLDINDRPEYEQENIIGAQLNLNSKIGVNSPTVYFDIYNETLGEYETKDSFTNTDFETNVYDLGDLRENTNIKVKFWIYATSTNEFYQQEIFIDQLNLTTYTKGLGTFEKINITNLDFTILGVPYAVNITLDHLSTVGINTTHATSIFAFSTTDIEEYDHLNDIIFPLQNVTYFFNFTSNSTLLILNFTTYYSSNFDVIPSEVDLRINGIEVEDESLTEGSAILVNYEETLIISASSYVYFELAIVTYFTLTFDLDVISKTYLRKYFKLLSDHDISIEMIALPSELDVKKAYMNSDELSTAYNPILLSPSLLMSPDNIFKLEIILADDLYIPLQYAYNSLGMGTSDFYLFGLSNSISYNNVDRFDDFSITTPSDFNTEYTNLSFSDLKYTPDYTSDPAQNIHNSSVEQNLEILDPEIQYFNSTEQLDYYNILNTSESVNSTFIEYGTNTTNLDNTYEIDNNGFNLSTEGVYPATYTFTNETELDDWTIVDPVDTTVQVISDLDGHSNVVEMTDDNAGSDASMDQFPERSSGTVEFWIRVGETDKSHYIIIGNNDFKGIHLYFHTTGQITYYSGGYNNLMAYNPNQWYHIKIEYDLTDWSIWIDEVSKGTGLGFHLTPDFFNVHFATSSTTCEMYIDAIGYSWDDNYEIGDNLNEYYNLSSQFQFNFSEALTLEDIKSFNMSYNIETNISQTLNISIYNFVSENYELINSSNFNSYFTNVYERNNRTQNYFDSNLGFNISIIGYNALDDFNISIDYLKLVIEYYNGTILSVAPSLSVIYTNPIYVNQTYNITVIVEESCYEIDTIWFWDNITENNQTIGNSEGIYNITVNFTTSSYYNFSVFSNDTQGSYRMINVSFLSVIKMACFIDVSGLYNGYFQNQSFSFNITMRDYLNNPLNNSLVNISLTNETYDTYLNHSFYTDEFGNIEYNFTNNFTLLGFYHFNFSYYSNEYLNYSKTMSFEILPYERSVNSSDINLKVNNYDVIDNFIQINYTSSISIECLDNSTFDLDVVLALNYTESISYERLLSYSFDFDATPQITNLNCSIANISNSPTNFTYYYYDNDLSSNYALFGDNLEISDLVNTILFNQDEFKVDLVYYQDERVMTQITETPSTASNSVVFQEYLLANRSFSYWYFSESLTVNSVSLYHIRTGNTIDSFEVNNSRYYFEETCLVFDLFNATIDFDPNWQIDYTILTNNGTYSYIQIDYLADLSVENVSIVLDLSLDGLYNDNWTLNANQSSYSFELVIPMVNFTTMSQTIYIEGFSSIPYVTLSSYESDQAWNQIAIDNTIDFIYLVDFPKFSTIFLANINENWNCYNFYYGTETYAIESMSDMLIKITGAGFDPSISESYIHFTTNPFTTVDFDYTDELITITIVSTLDVENCYFKTLFDPTGVHTLSIISSDVILNDLTDSGDFEGYLYFYVDKIIAGTTIIKIRCNFATPGEFFLQALLPFILGGVFIGLYYYLKQNEHILKNLKAKIENWEESREKKGGKGISKASFEIKDNKIYFTPEED